MELGLLICTQCETHMLEVARPLMRIFGDVRGFHCPECNYMILEHSKRMVHADGVGKQSPQQLDVASINGQRLKTAFGALGLAANVRKRA